MRKANDNLSSYFGLIEENEELWTKSINDTIIAIQMKILSKNNFQIPFRESKVSLFQKLPIHFSFFNDQISEVTLHCNALSIRKIM